MGAVASHLGRVSNLLSDPWVLFIILDPHGVKELKYLINSRTGLGSLSHNMSNVVRGAGREHIHKALSTLLALAIQAVSTGWLLSVADKINSRLSSGSGQQHERHKGLWCDHFRGYCIVLRAENLGVGCVYKVPKPVLQRGFYI